MARGGCAAAGLSPAHTGAPLVRVGSGVTPSPGGLLVVTPVLPLPCSTMMANAATMRILIKGGKVVNDDCTLEADVYIENGIIQQVGRELMIPGGAKVIDATGKLVIPGGIDTSTHFHQTFMNATCVDDFYHGTKVPLQPEPPCGVCSLLWGLPGGADWCRQLPPQHCGRLSSISSTGALWHGTACPHVPIHHVPSL